MKDRQQRVNYWGLQGNKTRNGVSQTHVLEAVLISMVIGDFQKGRRMNGYFFFCYYNLHREVKVQL